MSIFIIIKTTQALLWAVRSFSDFEANLTSVERIKEYGSVPQEVISRLIMFI